MSLYSMQLGYKNTENGWSLLCSGKAILEGFPHHTVRWPISSEYDAKQEEMNAIGPRLPLAGSGYSDLAKSCRQMQSTDCSRYRTSVF